MKSLNQLGRWIRGLTPAGRRKNAAPRIHPAHAAYMSDLRESQLAQTIPGTLAVLYLVAAILVCGLVWAKFARVGRARSFRSAVNKLSRALKAEFSRTCMCAKATSSRRGNCC